MRNYKQTFSILALLVMTSLFFFQNCGQSGSVNAVTSGKLDVCNGVSCELTPLTSKPAVTTILLALGDEANQQLVINGASSQLIAETVIRYSSPKSNPKILVVLDGNNKGEDPEDTRYVANVLLKRYNASYMMEPANGLTAQDVNGYDVIWFNNPGYEMGSQVTYNTLLNFAGAVVLQGDDLTKGNGFSIEALTGLRHINNGTSVSCRGKDFAIDDNAGGQYQVSLSSTLFPQANLNNIQFVYGNDIDQSEVVKAGVEVMALAKASPEECVDTRPAIVRYLK